MDCTPQVMSPPPPAVVSATYTGRAGPSLAVTVRVALVSAGSELLLLLWNGPWGGYLSGVSSLWIPFRAGTNRNVSEHQRL